MEEEITERFVRCAMYKDGKLLNHYDFDLDGIERSLQDFEGAVDDEMADSVKIILYRNGRRVTGWNTPVDREFKGFLENLIEELVDERFIGEVENAV